jgi:hypothetical protein
MSAEHFPPEVNGEVVPMHSQRGQETRLNSESSRSAS